MRPTGKIYLLLFLCCLAGKLPAQLVFSGQVRTTGGKPVAAANITLHKGSSGIISAFSVSDVNGNYRIRITHATPADSLRLEVVAIGYEKQQKQVSAAGETTDFVLAASSSQLPTVIVKNNAPFARFRNDTLSYTVDSFVQRQDRSIGDVLKRMPGIDVDGNGKITYNGKAISNFYIDGDNLLDDRYNIATNSIAADMVDKIQVLENHQSVKALQNAVLTDKVALNLSLKDKARLRLMGMAEAGAGIKDIRDITLNLMMFRKNYKAINAVRSNNNGADLRDDIVSHNQGDLMGQQDRSATDSYLGMTTSGSPNVNKQRYLLNNANLLNFNNLFKTRDDLQLKLNLFYLSDIQHRYYNGSTRFYLPGDTVYYTERQEARFTTRNFRAQFNVNRNSKNFYLNNNTVAEAGSDPGNALIVINGNMQSQQLLQKTTNISNEFSIIRPFRSNRILELYAYQQYTNNPEQLHTLPGTNEPVFNNNQPYLQLSQLVKAPSFFTTTSAVFRIPGLHLLQAYKVGLTTKRQELRSNIITQQQDLSEQVLADSFANHLHFRFLKLYAQADYDWISGRTQLSLSIPVNATNIRFRDDSLQADERFSRYFFTPAVKFRYATGREHDLTLIYRRTNTPGTMETIYPGYILKNYRVLMNNLVPYTLSATHYAGVSFNFKKTTKLLFAGLLAAYSKTENNTLSSTAFSDNLQKISTIPGANNLNSLLLQGNISKYLFPLQTTASLKASWRTSEWNQLQNNNYLQYNNGTTSFGLSLKTKFNRWLNTSYNISYTETRSKQLNSNTGIRSSKQVNQTGEINIIPGNTVLLKFTAEHYYTKQAQLNTIRNFFADASLQYKLTGIRTDLFFSILNITDVRNYTVINLTANNLSESNYVIRPRVFLLKAAFNF